MTKSRQISIQMLVNQLMEKQQIKKHNFPDQNQDQTEIRILTEVFLEVFRNDFTHSKILHH